MDFYKLAPALLIRAEQGDDMALIDAFGVIKAIERINAVDIKVAGTSATETVYDDGNFGLAHEYNRKIRKMALDSIKHKCGGSKMVDLYKNTLLFDAPHDFDCAIRYAEFNRDEKRKFYEPRRKQLLPVVKALQRLEDGELNMLSISVPPGCGKTTLALFFLRWTGGKHPQLGNLMGSHSVSLLHGAYEEMIRLCDPNNEYLWEDIFPQAKLVSTRSKDMQIDLGEKKRFGTFQFGSLGTSNAGRLRAANLLYCDDLIDGIETAMSRDRLDKIYQQYTVDLRQRKIGDAKELHIATRWSVNDVIGRLEQRYKDDEKALFITIPALNENDESNFDYPYNLGFTTKFYREQRDIMDEPSWKALYMNQPIEREGLLYPIDELKRYFELPDGDPDAIIAVCDTKTTGSDYCVLPIAYKYGNDFYIEDVVCENYAPDAVENSVVNMLIKHDPHMARFESNVAGGKMAQVVQERIKAKGCRTKITTKWTQEHKETKIQVESPWIKQHCYFKDDSVIKGSKYKEYRDMLAQLCSYTLAGKNKHDDVPDAFAQLSQFAQGIGGNKAEIHKRWF